MNAAFDKMGNTLGCTDLVKHKIKTSALQKYDNQKLNQMLANDIIGLSDFPYLISCWSRKQMAPTISV